MATGHKRSSSRDRILDRLDSGLDIVSNGIGSLKRRLSNGRRNRDDATRSPVSLVVVETGMTNAAMGFNLRTIGFAERAAARELMMRLGGRYEVTRAPKNNRSDSLDSESPIIRLTPSSSDASSRSSELSPTNDPLDRLPAEDIFDKEISAYPIVPIAPADSPVVAENVMDIRAWTKSGGDLFMRVLLDSGCDTCVICEEKAHQSGYDIEPYRGLPLLTASGQEFMPVGSIKFQWHFVNRGREKTYTCLFQVVPDECPYDVILGFDFIQKAELLRWNLDAFVLVSRSSSKAEKESRDRKEKEMREHNEKMKEKARIEAREKRQAEGKGKQKI